MAPDRHHLTPIVKEVAGKGGPPPIAPSPDTAFPQDHFFVNHPHEARKSIEKCVSYIIQHEGLSRTEGFRQFLSLLCAKLYEERSPGQEERRFRAAPREGNTEEGERDIHRRILTLFEEAKRALPGAFEGQEKLTFTPRTIAAVAGELGKHTLSATCMDALSVAYQQFANVTARTSLSQFFSPMSVASFVIDLLAPEEGERVLDYTCGGGAFIAALYAHHAKRLGLTFAEGKLASRAEGITCEEVIPRLHRAMRTAFGADIDSLLVEVAKAQMALAGGDPEQIYHLNSLTYPGGALEDERASHQIALGTLDCMIGNPPFDSTVPLDQSVLQRYELAYQWRKNVKGHFQRENNINKQYPLIALFLECALAWLRPGGRLAIIVPEGVLGNPGTEFVRAWLLRKAQILAVISLPRETFQVETGTHEATSVLLARKLTEEEQPFFDKENSAVFMAVCECTGTDSRGRPVYQRKETGETVLQDGKPVVRNELPIILQRYRQFSQAHIRHLLVALPPGNAPAFKEQVLNRFGLRARVPLWDTPQEEKKAVLYYRASANPLSGYERFLSYLSRLKEEGPVEDVVSPLPSADPLFVTVLPSTGHFLQILPPDHQSDLYRVVDLTERKPTQGKGQEKRAALPVPSSETQTVKEEPERRPIRKQHRRGKNAAPEVSTPRLFE